MKTSNELHDLWVAQGDKVENLNEKLNVAMLDDSVTVEELQAIKNERDTCLLYTSKELEDAGFSWVFDCPGVEVKEVE